MSEPAVLHPAPIDVHDLMTEVLANNARPISEERFFQVVQASWDPEAMKVVGKGLSDGLKTKKHINPVLKSLFLIDKLLVNHQIVNPVFINSLYKWKNGFVKLSKEYTFEKNGAEIGGTVRNLAERVCEDLEASLLPPDYQDHEQPGDEEVEEDDEDDEEPVSPDVLPPEFQDNEDEEEEELAAASASAKRPVFDRVPTWEAKVADAFADVPAQAAVAKKVVKKKKAAASKKKTKKVKSSNKEKKEKTVLKINKTWESREVAEVTEFKREIEQRNARGYYGSGNYEHDQRRDMDVFDVPSRRSNNRYKVNIRADDVLDVVGGVAYVAAEAGLFLLKVALSAPVYMLTKP
eukprot:TRINITY_DN28685_c0_g1_i1.p1 TRINITY_DN28685_c0_g1~~TRINITY_DN28685_c0_g1_i1.p1  ORF type:complete len:356 (-),score=125.57 TRINITY_DN28685_c0_g1_i1:68-1114(-)